MSTSQAHATNAPLLRCEVTYAGTTQQIDTQLSNDPYTAQIHDIGGRFSFKAVMIGEPNKPIHYIKLYAYLQGRDFDIPIHQATYQATRQAPIRVAKTMRALTPFNHLYAGEVEREMQYQCYLGWDKK
ncbi:hypothetical protein H8K55_13125 [Undibacterium sp. LX15W]|uniref:Uncharacterized protein n=1 Tax=Undibacterium flavidum TaxID=2762297 RepID=A0ABR6YDC5_9BURK|nr:hypothetical protein [Undibacterium flavidum]